MESQFLVGWFPGSDLGLFCSLQHVQGSITEQSAGLEHRSSQLFAGPSRSKPHTKLKPAHACTWNLRNHPKDCSNRAEATTMVSCMPPPNVEWKASDPAARLPPALAVRMKIMGNGGKLAGSLREAGQLSLLITFPSS